MAPSAASVLVFAPRSKTVVSSAPGLNRLMEGASLFAKRNRTHARHIIPTRLSATCMVPCLFLEIERGICVGKKHEIIIFSSRPTGAKRRLSKHDLNESGDTYKAPLFGDIYFAWLDCHFYDASYVRDSFVRQRARLLDRHNLRARGFLPDVFPESNRANIPPFTFSFGKEMTIVFMLAGIAFCCVSFARQTPGTI